MKCWQYILFSILHYFLKDTGLYYDEYLKQVIDVLETDKHFREKLQTADIEEIKVGTKKKKVKVN